MHGDFSRFQFGDSTNARGILHQQGRVLLDHDVNALTYFSVSWQESAARDLLGRGIAAIPSENPDAGRIASATVIPHGAMITLRGGRLWANGTPIRIEDGTWRAEYIVEPADAGAPGTRDAVLLETWFETVSGFQDTSLLEPALGGPDTTVRVINGTTLRLERMMEDEHCEDVVERLSSDSGGRLTVRLAPAETLGDADCPIEDPGGYRGPEHHMYRIEMAHTNDNVARFKWSRFNGGLLAQGTFDATTNKLRLQANHRAVATADLLPAFYVEALAYDPDLHAWRVIYGGRATLANDHEIDLTAQVWGATLPAGERVAVRIWDGLEDVAAFPATGAPLRDGIVVAFTDPSAPGDYWTFIVRAGQANPEVLIDDRSAEGVQRNRVALGTLTWTTAGTITEADAGAITDCRRPFAPLTSRGCCTIRVGDGGDVRTLQEAFDRLPPEGGTVCVLPGEHAGGHLKNANNVTIHGCGIRSKVVPPEGGTAAIQITDSTMIRIYDLYVEGGDTGGGIVVAGSLKGDRCRMIEIEHVAARAAVRPAILVEDTARLVIRDCLVVMVDSAPAPGELAWTAIVVDARDAVIERNTVEVQISQQLVIDRRLVRAPTSFAAGAAQVALGGVWLRGGCQRVRVAENTILGGTGHGVVLGHAELVQQNNPVMTLIIGWPFGTSGPCAGCIDGGAWIPWDLNDPNAPHWKPGLPLADIEIARNGIRGMGMAGIAVGAFFEAPSPGQDPVIQIDGLVITGNAIERCLARELEPIPDEAIARMGYGAIALADVRDLEIADNRITDNGTFRSEPVCGVYAYRARHATVRDNTITANGAILTGTGDIGPRAGVWFEHAEQTTRTALAVHANEIAAPTGPALRAAIAGGATITDNRFASAALAPVRRR